MRLASSFRRRVWVSILGGAVGAWALPTPCAGQVTPPFTQCPPVGRDTSCAILLLIEQDGSLRVKTAPSQGPYDGIEDTLIGVQNNSSHAVLAIPISGPNSILGFDGDGICGSDPFTGGPFNPRPPGCPFGPTGYEGPGVIFSDISADATSGTVTFAGGLQPGTSTYFSLELAIQTLCPPINGVPLLRQYDAQWRCDTYDNLSATEQAPQPKCVGGAKDFQACSKDADCPGGFCCTKKNTIGRWGCNLTSAAMIINYHAANQGVSFSTTPAELNTWLSQNGGYDAGGGVLPGGVVQYATTNGVALHYHGHVTNRDDFVLDQYICNGDPVMLKVAGHPTHFVVATGQTTVGSVDTYSINDPGYSNTTLAGYNYTYDGLRRYSSRVKAPNALYIRAHSPVELLLTDPMGRITGRSQPGGAVELEIPDSAYSSEAIGDDEDVTSGETTPEVKDLEVLTPQSGTYVLQAVGTDSGPFSIELIAYDIAGNQERAAVQGTISPGSTAVYDIGYTPSIPGVPFLTVTPRNRPPDCSGAVATPRELWPPQHDFVDVQVSGVMDPDGDPVGITIMTIAQDEPLLGLGSGDTCPDGTGVGTSVARLRAERSGTGDGRVYHVSFAAEDGHGGRCTGSVTVCVPHDQELGRACVDQGILVDSTGPCSP